MIPHVPTSMRLRGLYMSTMERVKSSALAPSLTSIASGLAFTMSRTTLSALWKLIGDGFFASVSAIFATFLSLRSVIAPVHSAGGFGQLPPMPASIAVTHEPMSPTTGASMRTLLSASCGEMSTWMKRWPPHDFAVAPPHVLPLPCDSSQLRRAPISITTSASGSTYERAADADCSCVSGRRPLAIDIGRYGMPGLLDERADVGVALRVCRALAEDDQRLLGTLQKIERALHRVRRRNLLRRGIDDLDERVLARLGVHRLREELGGQVEIHAAGTARHRGADRARDADADVLRVQDAERGLAQRLGDRELVHLLVVALLQVDDLALATSR